MLRHVVIWSLVDTADAEAFATALHTCADLVPGMREFDVGIRADGLEADGDVVLVATFDDESAYEAYLAHPHHRDVATGLGAMRSSRVAFDYIVGRPATMGAVVVDTGVTIDQADIAAAQAATAPSQGSQGVRE